MLINNENLQVPRLELRWSVDKELPHVRYCHYLLIMPLREIDARLDDEHSDKEKKTIDILLSITTDTIRGFVNSYSYSLVYEKEGIIELPHRDKMHAIWDAKVLGLPVYVTCGEIAQLLSSPGQIIHDDRIGLDTDVGYRKHGLNF